MTIRQGAFTCKDRKMLKGALHCHTTRSDGRGEPGDVIRLHAQNGYDFMALTDHRVYNYENFAPEIPMTARETAWLRESQRSAVIAYLTSHITATEAELRSALRLPEGCCGELLYGLLADGTVTEAESSGEDLRYQLRP